METSAYFYLPQTDEQLDFVIHKISHLSPDVMILSFEHNDLSIFSKEQLKNLLLAIPSTIKKMVFMDTHLAKIASLSEFFACLPRQLIGLDLSWNDLSHLSLESIKHLPAHLRELNLSLNQFNLCYSPKDFEHLLGMLRHISQDVIELNLSGNNLSELGYWSSIAQVLAATPRHLKSLDLSANGLGFFLSNLKDVFLHLPQSLRALNLSNNSFQSPIFSSACLADFKQAIKDNDTEVIELLNTIPSQIQYLELQNITLTLKEVRLELTYWSMLRSLKSLQQQTKEPLRDHLSSITQQFGKLYESNENLIQLTDLLSDCLLVIQGKIGLGDFKTKAKEIEGYVSPLWNYLGILMLGLASILCVQGLYVCGAVGLVSALGLFYQGRTFGLYRELEKVTHKLEDYVSLN